MRARVALYSQRDVDHSYGGYPLTIHLGDPVAEAWYDHDWAELPEIALLRTGRLGRGARVFNLGAHQAVVALMLARIVGPEGQVIAVEANPHNVAVARRNQEANGASQLTIVHGAVSDTQGSVVFNEALNGQVDDGARSWGGLAVEALTIDDLTRQYGQPDVLFIDVEGFEGRALSGAAKTLARRPDCFVEVHVNVGLEKFGGDVGSITKHFLSHDYECFMSSETSRAFVPLDLNSSLIRSRFFLVALARQR